MGTDSSKERSRKAFIQARFAIGHESRAQKNICIRSRFLNLGEYQKASTVFFYCSKDVEVDTKFLIHDALRSGKQVVLPRCRKNQELEARQILIFEKDVEEGFWGVLEPKVSTTQRVLSSDIDLFVIPGVAFDLSGNRMGWGKGYFDRYLKSLGPHQIKTALAYEVQVCEALPVEVHDIKMNVLVTEERVVRWDFSL